MVNSSSEVEKGGSACREVGVGEGTISEEEGPSVEYVHVIFLRRIIIKTRPVRFDRHSQNKWMHCMTVNVLPAGMVQHRFQKHFGSS